MSRILGSCLINSCGRLGFLLYWGEYHLDDVSLVYSEDISLSLGYGDSSSSLDFGLEDGVLLREREEGFS